MKISEEKANSIYNVLVNIAGASSDVFERASFVEFLTDEGDGREYRFRGMLGFGGKYRKNSNTVDCYREDENPETLYIIKETNKALSLISENPFTVSDIIDKLQKLQKVDVNCYDNGEFIETEIYNEDDGCFVISAELLKLIAEIKQSNGLI